MNVDNPVIKQIERLRRALGAGQEFFSSDERERLAAQLRELPAEQDKALVRALEDSASRAASSNLEAGIAWMLCGILAHRQTKAAVPLFCGLLGNPAERCTHEDITEYLGELGDPRAVPALEKLAKRATNEDLRELAAQAARTLR